MSGEARRADTDDGGADNHAGDARHERRVVACFAVTTVASLALAAVYLGGGQPQAEGALLALAMTGLGAGLVIWGSTLIPHDEVTGDRGDPGSPPEEEEPDLPGVPLGRRSVLAKMLAVAGGALGFALVFPVKSLGPSPGRSLLTTAWTPGRRVVTEDGQPVRAAEVPVDSILTVFPEGATEEADSQVILVNVGQALRPRRGRESWSPGGVVAYSKICTHAGCPVGLYRSTSHELLCPCHQSTFNVLDGCRPVFGPATRSLPQLPLAVNGAGELVAQGDFDEPVGPAYWNRR